MKNTSPETYPERLAFPARSLILTSAEKRDALNVNCKVRQSMIMPSGLIEVDLFSRDVNSDTHPDASRFRKILESVAEEYRCRLTHFEAREGTVYFSFDSDGLMADILKILQAQPYDPASDE